jgi:methylmalonyl-CoA mutase N-terminal domain/subunit
MGYDSDDPLARGEVGKAGRRHRDDRGHAPPDGGLPLDRVSILHDHQLDRRHPAALLLSVARERGISWSDLSGTVQTIC